MAAKSPLLLFHGVELASLGLSEIKSPASGLYIVAAVSMVIWAPRRRSCNVSSSISGASKGSPPVMTTWRVGYLTTSPRMFLTLQVLPSGCHDVYGVSHQRQRKLQPLVRTNTEGTPSKRPSPWIE